MDLFHSERSKLSTVLALLLLLRQGTVSGQDRKPSRTSQYDTSNLNCQIGTKRPKNADLSYQDFEYWYAMGTTGDIDSMKMFNLEQLLYNNVEDDMVWCWEEANDTNKSATKPTQGVRRDRKQRLVAEKKILGMVDSRNLNIITFTPGSMDKETSRKYKDERKTGRLH